LIEAAEAGVLQDAAAFRAGVQGQSAGDAIVGVDAVDVQMMQGAVALGELALGDNRTPTRN
jgi:hypothetical protein